MRNKIIEKINESERSSSSSFLFLFNAKSEQQTNVAKGDLCDRRLVVVTDGCFDSYNCSRTLLSFIYSSGDICMP